MSALAGADTDCNHRSSMVAMISLAMISLVRVVTSLYRQQLFSELALSRADEELGLR